MEEKRNIVSPTLKYAARGYEYIGSKSSINFESHEDNGEIELHTFNDWQKIKADPTIDISVFIDEKLLTDEEIASRRKR
jgi:hypothetical protein